mgnify:FL=1
MSHLRSHFRSAKELIDRSNKIILIVDERLDGDTLGSTLGWYFVLTALGKSVRIWSSKEVNHLWDYIPGTSKIETDFSLITTWKPDLGIVSDSSDGVFLQAIIKTKIWPLISFDHHSKNPGYANLNLIDQSAASTADVVWTFLKWANYEIPTLAAQALLTGIFTDTNIFSSPNTTSRAVEAGTHLISLGANPKTIVQRAFMNKSLASLKLWGTALERLFPDPVLGGIATALTLADFNRLTATPEDGHAISNFLNQMLSEEYDLVTVYQEQPNFLIKGSSRSRQTDVAKLVSEHYGGGGHPLAAGFTITNAKLIQVGNLWKVERISKVD